MSKLYNEYLKLKNQNPEKIYLFKSGIFYISLNEDAEQLSKLFNFKITNLNDTVTKCGFPQKRLEYYTNLLTSCSVDFEIIDSNYPKIENYSDYLNNIKLKEIIDSIRDLDMNNITFQELFNFLSKINSDIKNIFD